jgi:hypothetical protein
MAEQQDQEQDHQQTFLGMPMNWEWNPSKMARNYWNPDDDRIFPPRVFGIGWDLNGHALMRRFGLLPQRGEDKPGE